MRRILIALAILAILAVVPPQHAYHTKTLPDGSLEVIDLPSGHITITPKATLASYAIYPRPSSLSSLQYRQIIVIENPSSANLPRPVTVTLDLHDVAYYTTLVLTDANGNLIPFQVLSYTDSDGDDRIETATITFIVNIPAGGKQIFFLYYDNRDESTPIHNSVTDYIPEVYGLTASIDTRSTSSGSLSSQRTGISVSRYPVYQNNATFGDSANGDSNTIIGTTFTITVGNFRYIIYATPKYIYGGSFDIDNDGNAESADGYTFREGLQVIQYRDGSQRVDIVRYTPTFGQGTDGSYGYTVDIFSPFVFESHAFVLDTDNDGDVGDASDPSSADPSALKSYTDPGNPYTIHIDTVDLTVGPVMIEFNGQAFVVPMNVLAPNSGSLQGRNDYENFNPNFSFLKENVIYKFYRNTPYVFVYRKLTNTGSSSVRLSDSFSFMDTQPLLHHTNVTDTALVNDPIGYPGDTTSDAGTFFQIHTRYDIDNVPPYTNVDVARPRGYGLADILGTSPTEKYVYLGRSSDAPNRTSTYPPAIIGMILTKSDASGLSFPNGTAIADPFQTFYSRSITYGRVYSATTDRYDTDGQYATASIGLVRTDNTGLILDSNGYIEGEVVYAIFYGSAATPTNVANAMDIARNFPIAYNDPSSVAARESYYNLTVKFVDYQGDALSGASVSVSYNGETLYNVTTDTDGGIILKLGANGTYTLTFTYETIYGTFVESFDVNRQVNGSNYDLTLTAAIQDIDVHIYYPDGTPADGVTLTIYGENSSYTGQTTEQLLYNITLSSGYYHVENLPEGYYRFVITKYFGPIKVSEEHTVEVNATNYSFSYYLDVAKLSVSVLDPDGEPVIGATVDILAYNGSDYVSLYTGTTNTSGIASFLRVPLSNQTDDQPIEVVASYTEYGVTASEKANVTLTADDSIAITLGLYDLTISVYDSENIPAANGTITVTITYNGGASASFSFDSYNFTIENLPAASYAGSDTITIDVTYSIFDVSDSASASVTFTNDTSVSISLPDTRSVYFKVGYYDQSSNRVALAGATVEIYTPGGVKLPIKLTTNDTGYAVIHGLPYALNYNAVATYTFYGISTVQPEAFNNTAAKEVVTIAYNVVEVSIHVVTLSGEDVSGASISIYYSGKEVLSLTTGSDGYARYFPVPSSSYINTTLVSVSVSYTTYGRLVTKTVTGVDRNSEITIALDMGRIDGSASLADGRTNIVINVDVYDSSLLPVTSIQAVGNFSIAYIPSGTYIVKVSYETSYGYIVSVNTSVTLTDVASVSFVIPVGTVGVEVIDAENNTVAGASVIGYFGPLSLTATTDSSGVAYFTDVPLSAAVGNVTFVAKYTLFGVSVTNSTSISVVNGTVAKLSLAMGYEDIYVYDADGNALAGASVTVTISGISKTLSTDASGKATFYLPKGYSATVEVSYTASNGASAAASVSIAVDLTSVSVTVPIGTIGVTVYDYENNALAGVLVSLDASGLHLETTTDTSGTASFYVTLNIYANITASYSDIMASNTTTVYLVAGGSYSIKIPAAHVTIYVHDYENNALAGVGVDVAIGPLTLHATTGSDGKASVYAPMRYNATITATYSDFNLENSTTVFLIPGNEYDVELPLGHISVLVKDYEGNALSGLPVEVRFGSYSLSGTTSSGVATFYVPIGENATIIASYPEFGLENSTTVVLELNAEYSITLAIAHVTVYVHDYENTSISGADVTIGIGTLTLSGTTNSTGYAEIYSPIGVNGTIEASVTFAGVPIRESISAILEPSVYDIAIPLGHVYIKALTYDGYPISGADVTIAIGSIRLEGTTGDDGVASIYSLVNVTASVTVYFATYDVYDTDSVFLVAGQSYAFYLPLSHIKIVVTDYDGRLISGAKVSMDVLNYHYEGSTVNGTLDIPTVVNATATITISYQTIYGFVVSTSSSVELAPNATYSFKLPLATLNVSVYDVLGRPLATAKVDLSYQGTIFVSATTDTSGRVSIIQVPVGYPISLNVSYQTDYGYVAKYFEIITLSGPAEKSVTLQIGTLELSFTNLNGEAISGVKLTLSRGGIAINYNVPGSNITLDYFPIGVPYNITASVMSYGIEVYKTVSLSLAGASESYAITLPMKAITIKIVDLANNAVPMTRLTLSYDAVGTFFSQIVQQGILELPNFPVASYLGKLTASASYLTRIGVEVEGKAEIDNPAIHDTITVKLNIKPITIIVTDINGEPTTATVYIRGISAVGTVALTASNGTIMIPDFPLSYSPANITAVHIVRGVNGVTLPVKSSIIVDFSTTSVARISLELTDIDITVTDRNGQPLEGAIVTITAGNLEFKATTNAKGIAHFEDIPTLKYLGISSYHVVVDYGGVTTETNISTSGGAATVKAKTPADVQRQRIIAAIVLTSAVAGIVAYKYVLKARPPYYRLKKAIEKGSENIDLERLPTRDEELLEMYEKS